MGDPLGVNNLTTKLMIENRQSSEKFVAGLARLSAFGVARCRPPGSCCTCGSREAEVGHVRSLDSAIAQPLQRLIAFVNSRSKLPTRSAAFVTFAKTFVHSVAGAGHRGRHPTQCKQQFVALGYVAFLISLSGRFVRMALVIT
jgi:hypothetical protein